MSATAMGIDFGADGCVAVVARDGDAPRVIPSQQGTRVVPSVVYFDRDGGTRVGERAGAEAATDPSRAVVDVRRHLGDPAWSIDVDGTAFGAADVAALLLERVHSNATAAVGAVDGAVITVPAWFNDSQRRDTLEAARGAGVPCRRLVNEPTAVATAGAVPGRVLVFALGLTTLDVSVVHGAPGEPWEILAAEGDSSDADEAIEARLARAEHVIGRALKAAGVKAKALDAVLLAGPVARQPTVVACVRAVLGRDPEAGIDAVEITARGAAQHAAWLVAQSSRAA